MLRQLEITQEIGDQRGLCISRINLAEVAAIAGRRAEAARTLNEAEEVSVRIGTDRLAAHMALIRAQVAERAGDSGTARDKALEACAYFERIGNDNQAADLALLLGRHSDDDEAISHFRRAAQLAEGRGVRSIEMLATMHLVRLGRGDRDRLDRLRAAHESRLGAVDRIELHHELWRLTGDEVHRREARQALAWIKSNLPAGWDPAALDDDPLFGPVARAGGV